MELGQLKSATRVTMETKFKHLDYIQAAIGRMANNSFLFKGWAITIAAGLSAFAATNTKGALLLIAITSTLLFWALDGYYLWLERSFIALYEKVACATVADNELSMKIDKRQALRRWAATCVRLHLVAFYGAIIVIELVGIFLLRDGERHGT